MKGKIIFQTKNGENAFKVTNEHLMEELYHKIAFLAESGRGVYSIKERKKDGKRK